VDSREGISRNSTILVADARRGNYRRPVGAVVNDFSADAWPLWVYASVNISRRVADPALWQISPKTASKAHL